MRSFISKAGLTFITLIVVADCNMGETRWELAAKKGNPSDLMQDLGLGLNKFHVTGGLSTPRYHIWWEGSTTQFSTAATPGSPAKSHQVSLCELKSNESEVWVFSGPISLDPVRRLRIGIQAGDATVVGAIDFDEPYIRMGFARNPPPHLKNRKTLFQIDYYRKSRVDEIISRHGSFPPKDKAALPNPDYVLRLVAEKIE